MTMMKLRFLVTYIEIDLHIEIGFFVTDHSQYFRLYLVTFPRKCFTLG